MKIELTIDEWNVVVAGLAELPAKTSMGIIQKIQAQAQAQIEADRAAFEATRSADIAPATESDINPKPPKPSK